MRKADVHAHYGTLEKIAKAVGISKQGVWMWPDVVPEGHAYKLQFLTHGELKVNPALYSKARAKKRKGVSVPVKRRLTSAHSARAK